MIALKDYNQNNSNRKSNYDNSNVEYNEALFVQRKLDNNVVVFDFDIDKVIDTMDSLLSALNDIKIEVV